MPESADPSDENAPYDIISAGTSVNMVGKDGSVDAAIIQEFDHDADKIILRYENGGMGVLKERHIKNVYKKDGKYFLVL